ncbi:MAG: diaminopimelate epimerase [Bacteriovoracaceae bacterium]|jgi:diaminopimelate epimerase|nr:diaminopimelate epimerase [Bacteriovoracaceae bacterium]
MKLHFVKYSGHGNDFILVDKRTQRVDLTLDQIQKICDRRFGIGADGIIYIDHSRKGNDYDLRIWNLDGSEAIMCGNAARISVAYNYSLTKKTSFKFDTKNSVYNGDFKNDEAIIKMSELFDIDKYDISDLTVLGGMYLNTGVPHAVIQVADVENLNLVLEGAKVRHDERFDGGTNVCFFEVVGSKEIKFRVFERGVEGETLCCGTGVIASAITCKELFNWDGKIIVHSAGGTLSANIDKELSNILLCGKVEKCFEGTYEIR